MTDPAVLRALAARLCETAGEWVPHVLTLEICDALPGFWSLMHDAFSGELGACRAIHEGVLPGWGYRIDAPRMPGFAPGARVDVTRPGFASWDPPAAWPDGIGATARTVELAWVAAILLAKAEMLERGDG